MIQINRNQKTKIPDTNGLVEKIDYNTKITEIEGKIPDISNLATKTALTAIENKIPNISNLATKTLVNKVENRIPNIANLATKTALNTVKNKILDISNLATKTALTSVENKISDIISLAKKTSLDEKLKKLLHLFVLPFQGNTLFDSEGGLQAYLIFQPVYRYFKTITNTNYISSWKSKGLSNESFKPPTTSENSLNPKLNYYGYNIRAKLTGSCLKQSKVTYTHKKVVNIYIVYELGASNSHIDDPT